MNSVACLFDTQVINLLSLLEVLTAIPRRETLALIVVH